MPSDRVRWYPPMYAQAANWYLTLFLRLVGSFGFVWELLGDKGHNPLVLLLSVQLALSTDVLGLIRGLVSQAKMERRSLEELITEEEDRETRQKDSV